MAKICKINIRTILINFYLLPFRQAIHLPIILSRHCKIKGLYRGGVQIKTTLLKPGMIQIGYKGSGIIDERYERSIIEFGKNGKLIFHGRVFLGCGIRFSISSQIEIGNNVNITGNTSVICNKKIKIGDNSLISWDCLILDTDFHKIYNNEEILNEDKQIEIGNHVWIGAKTTILKGTIIPNDSVVGAGSLCVGPFFDENAIYAGHPIELIKRNINWHI